MDGHSAVQIVDCIGVIKSRIGAKVPTDEDGGGRGPKSRFGIAKRPQIERGKERRRRRTNVIRFAAPKGRVTELTRSPARPLALPHVSEKIF